MSDSNSQTEKEGDSNTSEAGSSPKKDNNTGFSNSPSLASISSLSNYFIIFNILSFFIWAFTIFYIQNVTLVSATKSVGGFFSGLTSYVEENKEWVKSVAADATSAIKENVKVISLKSIKNEIVNYVIYTYYNI